MARKGGNSTQRMAPPPPPTTTNGLAKANGHTDLPPPSTIAAQIVQNASNLHARHDAAAKVSFGELVKEFLQHPSTNEPDPQLVALICVIAEAGLEGLFKDDPFAQDQQRQQGIDSISALNLIIQKKPHLLLSTKDVEEEGGPQAPLFLWLYPKLLGLMSHITLQALHQYAQNLLGLCLEVLVRVPSFWRNAASLAALYRSSIEGKKTLSLPSTQLSIIQSSLQNSKPLVIHRRYKHRHSRSQSHHQVPLESFGQRVCNSLHCPMSSNEQSHRRLERYTSDSNFSDLLFTALANIKDTVLDLLRLSTINLGFWTLASNYGDTFNGGQSALISHHFVMKQCRRIWKCWMQSQYLRKDQNPEIALQYLPKLHRPSSVAWSIF
jgi:hypothetical protein